MKATINTIIDPVKNYIKYNPNFWIYAVVLIYAVIEGALLVYALETGKNKTRNIIILLPLIILTVSLIQRIRINTLIGYLLLIYWVPAGFDNWLLYIFEILLYLMTFTLILTSLHSDDKPGILSLVFVPWFEFLIFLVGALITWSVSTKTGGELSLIRASCLIPFALLIIFLLTIRTSKNAEHYLLLIMTSTAILGVLFLLGRNYLDLITLTDYAAGSGRLSMQLVIPYVGSMVMLPQRTSNWFGFLLIFAYGIWIFHPSFRLRTYGFLLCLLYGTVIISTSGRGGLVTGLLGAVVISLFAGFSRKEYKISGIWFKLALVILIVLGGFWYLTTSSTNIQYYQHGIALFQDPFNDPTVQYRFRMWANGWNLYLEHPLLGVGLRGIETPWGLDSSEVLNYFLYNLLSFGLIGSIGLMLILCKLVSSYLRGIRSKDRLIRMVSISSFCGMFGFLFGLQPLEPYSITLVFAPLMLSYAFVRLHEQHLLANTPLCHNLPTHQDNKIGGVT